MGRIERNRDIERDRLVLERILALLLALAGLADRASGLPAPDRLLAILGLGEAVACEFVIGMAHGATAGAAGIAVTASPASGHPDRLAASFRVLALVVGALLAEARRLAGVLPHEAGRRAALPMPPRGSARPGVSRRVARAPFAYDTS